MLPLNIPHKDHKDFQYPVVSINQSDSYPICYDLIGSYHIPAFNGAAFQISSRGKRPHRKWEGSHSWEATCPLTGKGSQRPLGFQFLLWNHWPEGLHFSY